MNITGDDLGSIPFAWQEFLIRVFVGRHAVVVGLVGVLAVAAVSDNYALKNEFNTVWNEQNEALISESFKSLWEVRFFFKRPTFVNDCRIPQLSALCFT